MVTTTKKATKIFLAPAEITTAAAQEDPYQLVKTFKTTMLDEQEKEHELLEQQHNIKNKQTDKTRTIQSTIETKSTSKNMLRSL